MSKTGAMLEGLGNSLILSVIHPKKTKNIETADGSSVELIIPDFAMYHVDGQRAQDHANVEAIAREYDWQQREELMADMGAGYTDTRNVGDYKGYLLGLVVGENLEARMPEYGTDDAHLKRDERRVVRWGRPAEMPRFGDVVLFRQNIATDWSAFWKMRCDTTPACEFLLCSTCHTRWLRVPRNADMVFCPLPEVWGVVSTFADSIKAQAIPV